MKLFWGGKWKKMRVMSASNLQIKVPWMSKYCQNT